MDRAINSSGRWDASGNIHDAILEQERMACSMAFGLETRELSLALEAMANDTNAYTLYERKYLLLTAAGRLLASDVV